MKRAGESAAGLGEETPPLRGAGDAGMEVEDPEAQPPPAQRLRPTGGAAAGAAPSDLDRDSLVRELMAQVEEFKRGMEQKERENAELQRQLKLTSPGPGPSQRPPRQRASSAAALPGMAPAPAAALGAFDDMSHLDGDTSFSQMVKDGVAVSPLAMHHPERFIDICKYLEETYPDPFNAVPPPAAFAQALAGPSRHVSGGERSADPGSMQQDDDSSDDDDDDDDDSGHPKCYMTIATSDGHCQCGKTAYAVVSAWLYYHFCGCHSFLAAWNFRDSPGRFIVAIDDFNNKLLKKFPDTANHVLTTTTPKSIFQHMCISATKELPQTIDDYTCNVFVQLNNATQLRKAKTYAETLAKGNTKLRDKLDKFPVVLLMDEDDENTQTATLRKYQREKVLFGRDPNLSINLSDMPVPRGDGENDAKKLKDVVAEAREAASLAEVAFSYVHISATNHATLIAAGVNGMYIHRVQRITIPNDYLGYSLPPDQGGWEIQRRPLELMYRTTIVEGDDGQMVERQVVREEWTCMVVNGCQRLDFTFPDDDHQLAGRIVCQLVCPKSPIVMNLNNTAEQVFVTARKELEHQGLDAAGIAVATFHGSINIIYCCGFVLEEIVHALDKVELKAREIDGSNAKKIKVKVGGTVVSALDLMNFFRALFERRDGKPMYTALVANYRAGRSVSFKDSEHFLHLTDGFFQKSGQNMRNLAHDNLLQALQRPFGRFKHYKNLGMEPPVHLWVSSELWALFGDAMRVHKQTTSALMLYQGNPYKVGMEFIWEHIFKPRFTKPGVNRALNAMAEAEGGYRLVLFNEQEPEFAAGYATLEANTDLAREEMARKGVQLPAGAPPLIAVNRVAIVHVADNDDFMQLRGAFSKNKRGKMTNAIKTIIQRLVGLEDDQMCHVFTIKKKAAWLDRMQRRLRARGAAHRHHPSVAAMLEGRKLICFIFDHPTVLAQAELYSVGAESVNQEGVETMAWWYPSHNPEEVGHVLLTLAVDLPADVPTGRPPMAHVQLHDDV